MTLHNSSTANMNELLAYACIVRKMYGMLIEIQWEGQEVLPGLDWLDCSERNTLNGYGFLIVFFDTENQLRAAYESIVSAKAKQTFLPYCVHNCFPNGEVIYYDN